MKKERVKVFFIDDEPYFVIDEDVKIGDFAIVTVSDQFPTFVECANEYQINLFQKPTLSSTKRYKVLFKPNQNKIPVDDLKNATEETNIIEIEYENSEVLKIIK
jgi:uncharacterized protein YxjI